MRLWTAPTEKNDIRIKIDNLTDILDDVIDKITLVSFVAEKDIAPELHTTNPFLFSIIVYNPMNIHIQFSIINKHCKMLAECINSINKIEIDIKLTLIISKIDFFLVKLCNLNIIWFDANLGNFVISECDSIDSIRLIDWDIDLSCSKFSKESAIFKLCNNLDNENLKKFIIVLQWFKITCNVKVVIESIYDKFLINVNGKIQQQIDEITAESFFDEILFNDLKKHINKLIKSVNNSLDFIFDIKKEKLISLNEFTNFDKDMKTNIKNIKIFFNI